MAHYIMDWLWVLLMAVVITLLIFTTIFLITAMFESIEERREIREQIKNYNRHR